MSSARVVRRSVFAVCFSLIASTVLAQAQTQTKEFQPTVGQAGKDVVWVPTPQATVDKMLDLAKVGPSDFVMDLGSGDGRTVITAAKRGARAMGIEYNPDMVTLSQANAKKEGVSDRASFVKADLYETDFSKATVITMFLLPEINLKLRPKILEMRPGTRVASNTFTMEDWQPDEQVTVTDGCTSWCTALFWIVPAKAGGTWKSAQGELTLTQTFQMVTGALKSSTGSAQITNGKLRGEQITFTAGGAEYSGKVNGSTIQGTVKSGGSSTAWNATKN